MSERRPLRRVPQAFGILFLILCVVALGGDITRSIEQGGLAIRSLGGWWAQFSPEDVAEVNEALNTAAGFWESVGGFFISLPAFAVFGLIGVLLLWLGRRKASDNYMFAGKGRL
jgi:hypothetical protein